MTLRAFCRFLVLLVACGLDPAGEGARAQSLPAVQWRVENPFRLFKDAADTKLHRDVYLRLKAKLAREPTISEMEHDHALATDGRGWAERFAGDQLKELVHHDACWHRSKQDKDRDKDATCTNVAYIRPDRHRVIVSVPGMAGTCEFRGAGAEIKPVSGPCAGTPLDLPYPGGATFGAYKSGQKVAGNEQPSVVRDYLVIGLGDSFASGEGNPNKAVRFHERDFLSYDGSGASWESSGYPARAGAYRTTSDPGFKGQSAQWLSRPCHRSVYSQQFRTALHLAIAGEEQHHAVTFVGLACTGAAIIDGLFEPWTGSETGNRSSSEIVTLGQLSGAARAICAGTPTQLTEPKYVLQRYEDDGEEGVEHRAHQIHACPEDKARKIDLLLLSIGGNDIGFSGLVANATIRLDEFTDLLADWTSSNPKVSVEAARSLVEPLVENYKVLRTAIADVLHLKSPEEQKRVVMTAYPMISYGSDGKICPDGGAGMDGSVLFSLVSAKAEETERFIADLVHPEMAKVATGNGWTWVEGHRTRFKPQGICASGAASGYDTVAETKFPRRRGPAPGGEIEVAVRAAASGAAAGFRVHGHPTWNWQPGGQRRLPVFKPYWPRERWVRTPNDAFLTAHLHEDNVAGFQTLARFMAYSGAFHPTAGGHAVIADEVVKVIRERGLWGGK